MAYWCDDYGLALEQRRLDEEQRRAKMYIVSQDSLAHCGRCHRTFKTLKELHEHKCRLAEQGRK